MPDWSRVLESLPKIPPPQLATRVEPWTPYLLGGLALVLVLLIVTENWRWSLFLWGSVGPLTAALMVGTLPLPWVITRMLAPALNGALLWLGLRRWPPRISSRWGWGPRWAFIPVAAMLFFQLRLYKSHLWLDPVRGDAVLLLLLGSLFLLALHGTTLHSTLALLLLIQGSVMLLAPLPMPQTWIYPLTLLDMGAGLVGSMLLASEGLFVRGQRRSAR